jgi:hypothetical protein
MIQVAVSVQRSFLFPADVRTTSGFFREFRRVLGYLPHLRLVKTFGPDQYRVLFTTTEAGVYRLAFYCDLQVNYDEQFETLHVTPLTGFPAVPAKASIGSLTGQGSYSSLSVLRPLAGGTHVDYEVKITATVAKRLEWRLIPDRAVEHIANERTRQRLAEMTDHFIARSIAEFSE